MADFYGKYTGIFGGGGGSSGTEIQEAPSGTPNGILVTFSLSQLPKSNASVKLYLDGTIQYQGVGLDYTISGATITMAAAPAANQSLWANYVY